MSECLWRLTIRAIKMRMLMLIVAAAWVWTARRGSGRSPRTWRWVALIRLSGCPTVDISEAMFGKWLVTMQCPSGQVLYRDGTGHGKPGLGSAWSPGLGKMRSVAAGPQVIWCAVLPWGHAHLHIRVQAVWGVNRAEEVFVRMGLTPDEPRGKDWTKIEGNMKTIR